MEVAMAYLWQPVRKRHGNQSRHCISSSRQGTYDSARGKEAACLGNSLVAHQDSEAANKSDAPVKPVTDRGETDFSPEFHSDSKTTSMQMTPSHSPVMLPNEQLTVREYVKQHSNALPSVGRQSIDVSSEVMHCIHGESSSHDDALSQDVHSDQDDLQDPRLETLRMVLETNASQQSGLEKAGLAVEHLNPCQPSPELVVDAPLHDSAQVEGVHKFRSSSVELFVNGVDLDLTPNSITILSCKYPWDASNMVEEVVDYEDDFHNPTLNALKKLLEANTTET
ncbi:hypothetical protein Nepgr_023845 [Nepenthes gracilis]|uniref:Uncharacterized protein n=1 Tax=Nepenthes gracilis TaxID=150966 RepID=A0AAD3XY26_NEPGR|nr:hypothetical protein Nepgr_023845 [Nepenthes gracilis]